MRLTLKLCDIKIHAGRFFKAHWSLVRKATVRKDNFEGILNSMGIEVVDPHSVLTPAIKYTESSPPKIEEKPIPKEPLYRIVASFSPIENLKQARVITNSVVRDDFPASILDKRTDVTPEEEKIVRDAILQALLLDAIEKKLPKTFDIARRPGINLRREFGISKQRGGKSLVHNLMSCLRKSREESDRQIVLEDVVSRSVFRHFGNLLDLKITADHMIMSEKPLERLASTEEVEELQKEETPDLYPFTPMVNVPRTSFYEEVPTEEHPVARGSPITICTNDVPHFFRNDPLNFYSKTLIQAFGHAFAHGRKLYGPTESDLVEPITVRIIHTNRKQFHLAFFQLNSMDVGSSTKNIFWHKPWQTLYDSIGYKGTRPYLEGLNVDLIRDLKLFV